MVSVAVVLIDVDDVIEDEEEVELDDVVVLVVVEVVVVARNDAQSIFHVASGVDVALVRTPTSNPVSAIPSPTSVKVKLRTCPAWTSIPF